jgi:hypothetical protein
LGKYISSGNQLLPNTSVWTPSISGSITTSNNITFIKPINGSGTVASVEGFSGTASATLVLNSEVPGPIWYFGFSAGYGFTMSYQSLSIYSPGKLRTIGSMAQGDSVTVEFDGSNINYYHNGEAVLQYGYLLVQPIPRAIGSALYLSYSVGTGAYQGESSVSLYFSGRVSKGGTMISSDGINWSSSGPMGPEWGDTTKVTCVIARQDTGQTLAIGLSGRGAISDDGITWEYHRQPISAYSGVWGDGKYVIGGSGGLLASSSDGINWVTLVGLRDSTPWGNNIIHDINWNGSQFIVVGVAGRTAISSDCFNWTYTGGWTGQNIYSVTWNGTYSNGGPAYMVAGTGGLIGRSS